MFFLKIYNVIYISIYSSLINRLKLVFETKKFSLFYFNNKQHKGFNFFIVKIL